MKATTKHSYSQLPLPIEGETFEILLTQGQVTVVDAIDADLALLNWYAQYDPSSYYYAVRNIPKEGGGQARELMHRVILSRMLNRPLLQTEQVDHIKRDTLDNRRSKLRLASNTQNIHNQGIPTTNKSGFKGVSWRKASGAWVAQINIDGKRRHLGLFATPEEAHEAYRKVAIELRGEFAGL